jgi:hypothetical protein
MEERMSTPQVPAPVPPRISFPTVTDDTVRGFARAWDCGGLKMILDNTSIKFAKDFANQALKSYVIDLMNKAAKIKAAAQKTNDGTAQKPNEAPKSSTITLTDAS